jgi:hypothetical protein
MLVSFLVSFIDQELAMALIWRNTLLRAGFQLRCVRPAVSKRRLLMLLLMEKVDL